MLDVAEATGNADLLIIGHMTACVCYILFGRVRPRPLEHADRVLDLYDAEKHRHLADLFNHDPKTQAGIFGLDAGLPGSGEAVKYETDAHALLLPFLGAVTPSTSDCLCLLGAEEFDHRYELED